MPAGRPTCSRKSQSPRGYRTTRSVRARHPRRNLEIPQITGGYARASYASGGGGASRVPRIAGDVTAALPMSAACWWAMRGKAPLLICSGAASRRGLPYGGSTRFYGGSTRRHGHLGRFTGLRCGDWRGAAGGCHCASLMMKRRAAATAVRPCARPGPGSPLSSFPQVTCLNRSGRPVLPPLFACQMRARPALALLPWSGDGSPVWGCTTTSGDQVSPRTLFRIIIFSSMVLRFITPDQVQRLRIR